MLVFNNQYIHRLSACISIASKAMAGMTSPERSTTHASNESAVSFGGTAARSCPAAASLDESVTLVGCEVHTREPVLRPDSLRPSMSPLGKSKGDSSPCVSQGVASRAGSQCSTRSRRQEGPPRTQSVKRGSEAAQSSKSPLPPTHSRLIQEETPRPSRRSRSASPRGTTTRPLPSAR